MNYKCSLDGFIICLAMCVYVKTYQKKQFVFSNLLSRVLIFVKVACVVYVLQKSDVISGKGA